MGTVTVQINWVKMLRLCCLALLFVAVSCKVQFFYSSVSGNSKIRYEQRKIDIILQALRIPYDKIDVAASVADRTRMRMIVGDPKALPPQLANDDMYCGDYAALQDALDNEMVNEFLRL